ncbi:MAG: ADP-ribosylglycohydrolase family protein [Chloroflexi bacterium]|nr:ADP-ribosylglycohydrolase family protein [Chloroflexota bacterium]
MIDLTMARDVAVRAALEAGARLRREFRRPPISRTANAYSVDTEVEQGIRAALLGAYPESGYCGEETGTVAPSASSPQFVWLVDPNDGTSAFLEGARGSAVSIGLLRDRVPVGGVVSSPVAPDDDGDLFAWAEGCGPILRNGHPVERGAWFDRLGPYSTVMLARHADRASSRNAAVVAPARFRASPSIAYRLALAAVGEADAAASLMSLAAWDLAAGHALIRAVGGLVIDGSGSEVEYSSVGQTDAPRCFAGSPAVAEMLRSGPWHEIVGFPDHGYDAPPNLVGLKPGESVSDVSLLRRAQGCLLGQLAGDSLGGLVEFKSADRICREDPQFLRNGGQWNLLAGQPTDDSEMALSLARSIVEADRYDWEAAARMYHLWHRSRPFDVGNTTGKALGAILDAHVAAGLAASTARNQANYASQANGSLMRVSPLGVYAHLLEPDKAAELARLDSSITHPNPVCQESCAAFTVAVSTAIRTGAPPGDVYAAAIDWATTSCRSDEVVQVLCRAGKRPPESYTTNAGWVLIALQNAFYQLVHAADLQTGVMDTVSRGGDTDTNAAIAGALLGATFGRDGVPWQWRQMILTCRPIEGLPEVRHPRPRFLWPVDALELAERLLVAGRRGAVS